MADQTIRDVVIKLAIDISNAQKNVDSLTASTDKLTKSLSAAQSSASIPIGAVGGVRATAAGSTASSAPAPIAANVKSDLDKAAAYRTEMYNRNALLREKDADDSAKSEEKRVEQEKKANEDIVAHRMEMYSRNKALRERDAAESAAKDQAMRQGISDNDVAHAVGRTNSHKEVAKKWQQENEARAAKGYGAGTRQLEGVVGSIGKSLGTLGVAIATAAAVIRTSIVLLKNVTSVSMQASRQKINKEQILSNWQGEIPFREAREHANVAREMIDVNAGSRYARQAAARNASESGIRQMESQGDLTASQKEFRRHREEIERGQGERVGAIDETLAFHGQQKQGLEKSITANDSAIADAKSRFAILDKKMADEQVRIKAAGQPRQIQSATGMFQLGMSAEELSRVDELTVQRGQAKLDMENKVKTALDEQKEATKKLVDLNEKDVSLLSEKHAVTKEMQQNAYRDLHQATEQKRSDTISFGAMHYGDQVRLKNIQNKVEAIRARKAENLMAGRDEWDAVPMLEKHEMQEAIQTGVGGKTAKAQAEREGRGLGLVDEEHEEDLEDRRDKFDEVHKTTEPQERKTEQDLDKGVQKTQELSARMVTAMSGVFAQESLVKQVESDLAVLKQQAQTNAVVRGVLGGFYSGGGF